ncbi:hypothetical protein [Helicobacter equorum]|uniref:Uncharacterized protein n=1 Tax=Helicobacter equorum TaxID=361872 RepID=A0A3D8ISU0_9HELI|nr:hypothetical protein [Helicobacter equorum]MCI7711212.1 hypothetical protein [Helicobacter sp.]MDD7346788.1 hypothetical protein [Helicobacter sp.]MDY2823835.1 hypothetical protein [Helicobacter sp.]RDU68050.1 hypothetical protein CQA54_03830 [Helicobacter equorum]
MKLFLKFFISALVGALWFHFGGNDSAMALVLFMVVLGMMFMKPIQYQDPKRREQYMQKIRESKERKIMLEKERLEERKRAKQNLREQEAKLKKDFENKLRNNR